MNKIVAVVKGTEKNAAFREVVELSGFRQSILEAQEKSGKPRDRFAIVIKPNMMVFTNPQGFQCLVTDPVLVEQIVDLLREWGFTKIAVCEAQNDVGRMLKNHHVRFIAEQIGYKPAGRYEIVDLTLEAEPWKYRFKDEQGRDKFWKDKVGRTWKEADYRITFAKCKTHEHDWMTLGIKNVYGCFPCSDKVAKYHIRKEVFDWTALKVANFPLHFSFIDAWTGSDGFQGYKLPRPKELRMFFAGADVAAVDMEVFQRAGLDFKKSRFLGRAVRHAWNDIYPEYEVVGDRDTRFSQIGPWDNIEDKTVESINILEEVYIAWGFINLRAIAKMVDMKMFPPKNIFVRLLVWLSKLFYEIFRLFPGYRRLYK